MKYFLFCFFSFGCFFAQSQANTTHPLESLKKTKIIIDLRKQSNEHQISYLKTINDTSLIYTDKAIHFGDLSPSKDATVSYRNIETISYHRKGAGGRTALVLGGICFGVGAILGLAEGDDDPNTWFAWTAGEKALVYGTALLIPGAVIGLVTGSVVHKKFRIAGSKSSFLDFRNFIFKKTHKVQKVNF